MHVCMHVYLSRGIYTSVYMKYLYQWLCKQVVREAELIVSIECIYTHQCEHNYTMYMYRVACIACLLLSSFLLISH